jgi:alkanesulfonate monooxygenase SsuD/methylene tetrahydromethanopterin reductase-like flavin-dependent oxidoreductase (luciferase family)
VIHVGLQYLGGELSPKIFATAAEKAGFDSVWCGDHLGHYIDGISTLGCFAGCTDSILIGSDVLVAPLRPAVVTAKALSTIARLAGPRFIAGIGVGGDFPGEFEAVGADLKHRGAFTDEFLGLLPSLLSGETVSFEGRFTRLRDFRIVPPAAPAAIWVGGRSDAALRRTAQHADGYLGYLLSPEGLAKRASLLAGLSAEAGRPESRRPRIACNLFLFPARTVEEGLDAAVSSGIELSGVTRDFLRSVFLLGDEESVLSRIRQYAGAGLDHLILGCPPGDERDFRAFLARAEALLPGIRELQPAAGAGPA